MICLHNKSKQPVYNPVIEGEVGSGSKDIVSKFLSLRGKGQGLNILLVNLFRFLSLRGRGIEKNTELRYNV